jgi:hypothetical protein
MTGPPSIAHNLPLPCLCLAFAYYSMTGKSTTPTLTLLWRDPVHTTVATAAAAAQSCSKTAYTYRMHACRPWLAAPRLASHSVHCICNRVAVLWPSFRVEHTRITHACIRTCMTTGQTAQGDNKERRIVAHYPSTQDPISSVIMDSIDPFLSLKSQKRERKIKGDSDRVELERGRSQKLVRL